jgi:hypothetical protein
MAHVRPCIWCDLFFYSHLKTCKSWFFVKEIRKIPKKPGFLFFFFIRLGQGHQKRMTQAGRGRGQVEPEASRVKARDASANKK